LTSTTSSGLTQCTLLRTSGDPKRLLRRGGTSSGIVDASNLISWSQQGPVRRDVDQLVSCGWIHSGAGRWISAKIQNQKPQGASIGCRLATFWATGSVVYRAVALSAIVTRDAASSTLVGATSLRLFIGNKRARKPLSPRIVS
jgi:hypothetical protein